MKMLSGRAFRAQLILQGQRELFDYWLSSAGARRMPARSDLDPLEIPQLLPSIGLIEIRDGLDDATFRVAGTRLRDIYGEEITGKRAGEVFSGEAADYWRRIHLRVLESGVPLHGVMRGPAKDRDHVVLFWLRLPLSETGAEIDRILCYDVAGPAENVCAQDYKLLRYSRFAPQATPAPRRLRVG
jgi:hypothetical protein